MKVTIYYTQEVLGEGFGLNDDYFRDDMENRYYGDSACEEWMPYCVLNDTNDSIELIVVLLPDPFGPSNPNISPLYTSKDKLSIAFFPLYSLVNLLTSITFSIKNSPLY